MILISRFTVKNLLLSQVSPGIALYFWEDLSWDAKPEEGVCFLRAFSSIGYDLE
jgi:hypothetical protein